MHQRKLDLQNIVGRLFLGSLAGCLLLLFVESLVMFRYWGLNIHWMPNERDAIIGQLARVALPSALVFGAILGLSWRPSTRANITWLEMLVLCAIVGVISTFAGPVLNQIYARPFPPFVANTLDAVSLLFLTVGMLIGIVGIIRFKRWAYHGTRRRLQNHA